MAAGLAPGRPLWRPQKRLGMQVFDWLEVCERRVVPKHKNAARPRAFIIVSSELTRFEERVRSPET